MKTKIALLCVSICLFFPSFALAQLQADLQGPNDNDSAPDLRGPGGDEGVGGLPFFFCEKNNEGESGEEEECQHIRCDEETRACIPDAPQLLS